MTRAMRLAAWVAAAVFSVTAAAADTLGDLRARLQSLTPEGALKARIELTLTRTNEKGKTDAQNSETVLAELGPEGLRLGWTPQQVGAARKAARRRELEPDAAEKGEKLGAISVSEAVSFLDGAPGLLLELG